MGGKRKPQLQIECEDISEMEKSIFSEIGSDGLRFLKEGVHIGPEGVATITGQLIPALLPTSKATLQVGERLGKGAACIVQRGVYAPLNIPVAIKSINAYDRHKRHQVMNDIRILLGNLIDEERHGYKCNFLVNLYGAYFEQGTVKVILELMDAGSLQDVISLYRVAKVKPQIDEGVLAKVAIQILCGLSYLHGKNQIHRDIKPANILLNSRGEVKLSDFGIARQLLEEEDFSSTVIGTLSYKSPERMISRRYGYKSDIWSLGLLLQELASGQFPLKGGEEIDLISQFKNQEVKRLPEFYSPEFQDFLDCALSIEEGQRWSSLQLVIGGSFKISMENQVLKSGLKNFNNQFQKYPDFFVIGDLFYSIKSHMNRGIRNVVDDRNQGQGDLARPVFQQGEIENHGIWIELVPHLVKMIIVDSGNGGTPVAGDFIRVKQYIYLENMTLVKGERATLLFGKGHLLPGLEICLAICREGFKARCFLAPNYAYGAEKAGKIPANSCLIIDIEVATITKEPVLRESEDDNLLVGEIVSLEREGLNFFRKGDSVEAQLRFESAFARIQSTRSKEIKNYLYSNTKSQYFNNEQIPSLEKKKDQQYLVQLYKKFDSIKVRTVQLALLNKDYYKVLILSKQCLMESRLEINDTILMARSKAFAAVGQFDEAVKLAEHLKSKHPEDLHLKEELEKIYKREDMFLDMLDQMDEDFDEPILNLFPVNLNIKKEKKKVPKKLQSQKFKKQEV